MTLEFTVEHCLLIYAQDVKAGVLRDRDALESAVASPFTTYFGEEQFPTLIQKAARLAFGIAEAQAFDDGNKRLAWLCSVLFLEVNGTVLDVEQAEAARAIRALGEKKPNGEPVLDLAGLTEWYVKCVSYEDA
ncbi:type II toxin-antitoxin system death-on-curing family toxin [Cutibacterium avidum]|uniref:type II toxin-antitoxin system death-on-curing family toxin n=1 Tax=Cutibacterium avidum TaxID=33010 RepID=UPI001ED916FC|nr:Fic family protein [Cutibacterium avidum]